MKKSNAKLLAVTFLIATCCVGVTVQCKIVSDLDECLEHLSSNSTVYLNQSHSVMKFHLVANLTNITIKGPANITCAEGVGLVFINVTDLTLANITIQQCGLTGDNLTMVNDIIQTNVANTSYQFRSGIKVGVFVIGSVNVIFKNVVIKETQGIGIVYVNVLGQVTFTDVMFIDNRPTSLEECYKCLFPFVLNNKVCIYNPASVSGSLLLLYANNHTSYPSHDVHVSITRTDFIDNLSCSVASFYNAIAALYPSLSQAHRNVTATGGIKIVLSQNVYTVSVQVVSSLFRNNTAFSGSAINVEIFEDASLSNVTVKDCTFLENGMPFANVTTYGGSITVVGNIRPFYPTAFLFEATFTLVIQNCNFTSNFATIGGAIIITQVFSSKFRAHISDTHFEDNTGVLGICIFASGTSIAEQFTAIAISNSSFVNNAVIESFSFDNSQGSHGAIYLNLINGECSDTVFSNNSGSAVSLVSSILTLSGKVLFNDNKAFDGGALYLQINSVIVVANNSEVMFTNNSAISRGGAIFFNLDNLSIDRVRGCFLYFSTYDPYCLLTRTCYSKEMNISISFIDNTATTGSVSFGFDLECPWLYDNGYNSSVDGNILDFINNTFGDVLKFIPHITDDNVVATRSQRINVNPSDIMSIIPGQIITVGLNASDFYQRSVITVVSATTLSNTQENYSAVIPGSGFQLLHKNSSTPTQIKINGTEGSNINFTLYSLTSNAQATIAVEFTDCPVFGFYYNALYRACVCDPNLVNEGISCDYGNIRLVKPEDRWVGQLDGEAVVHPCLFDYCSKETLVDPNNLNDQCSSNRAGVLCGGCKDGYGIKIGLGGCDDNCSNIHLFLWLLVAFIYSLWIVAITAILHFYVSDGFLYGFILYYNTLYIFRRVLSSPIEGFVAADQFVYASNLCLYEEITPLVASGLEFIPPLFIFFGMGIVIVLAKRFNFFNRRFSFSVTKTFATLLYITYNWLLNASFNLLVSQQIKTPSRMKFRWAIDPNVVYFGGWHAGLGVISVITILVLSVIALILLFPGLAYRFKRIQRLKPLMDAFQAPFKLEYSFWIGLQLLMRIVLYLLAIFVPVHLQLYSVAIILLLLLIAQTTVLPYKEISYPKFRNLRNFIDNLLLFFLLANIIEAFSFQTDIFVLALICYIVTMVMYIGFILYYFFKRFSRIRRFLLRKLCWFRQRSPQDPVGSLNSQVNSEMEENDDKPQLVEFNKSVRSDYPNVARSSINIDEIPETVNYTEFREPLLEKTNY